MKWACRKPIWLLALVAVSAMCWFGAAVVVAEDGEAPDDNGDGIPDVPAHDIPLDDPAFTWTVPENGQYTGTATASVGGGEVCRWEYEITYSVEYFNDYDSDPVLGAWSWYYDIKAVAANIKGVANAYDVVNGTSVSRAKSAIAGGTVKLRCLSKPACSVCTTSISVTTQPSFKTAVVDFNASARGEAAGFVKVLCSEVSVDCTVKGGTKSEDTAAAFTIDVGPVTITGTSTTGVREDPWIDSDSGSALISQATILLSSAVKVEVFANGWTAIGWPFTTTDDGKVAVRVKDSKMSTTIVGRCFGCCAGTVTLVLKDMLS